MTDNRVAYQDYSSPVNTLDFKTLEEIPLGNIVTRVYQGEELAQPVFVPVGGEVENGIALEGKRFRPRTNEEVPKWVDHVQVLRPLYDLGLQHSMQSISADGTEITTRFYNPLDPGTPDPFTWDEDLYRWRKVPKALRYAVTILSDVKGKVRGSNTVERLICSNGAHAKILDLGGFSMSSDKFAREEVVRFVQQSLKRRLTVEAVRGPYVGNRKGIQKLGNMINERLVSMDADDQDPLFDLPYFAKEPLTTISRLPGWYIDRFSQLLRTAAERHPSDNFYGLDLVNLVTGPLEIERRYNALNAEREVNYGRMEWKQDTIVKAAGQFIGAYSLN